MSVIDEIAAERRRQVEAEGWTPEHDDTHDKGEMAKAAACYTLRRLPAVPPGKSEYYPHDFWPRSWAISWWKPTTYRRNLIKAAALIVAEIERLDRLPQEDKP